MADRPRKWRFENRTTGDKGECNDLDYLYHQLKEDYGLIIPRRVVSDVLLRGRTERTVLDENGEQNLLVIEEFTA